MKKTQSLKSLVCNSDVNIFYSHLEMLRIDLIIRKAVEYWQQAGQDANEKFRGLFINEQHIRDLLNLPVGGDWGKTIQLPPELEDEFSHNASLINEQLSILLEEANQTGQIIRLQELKNSLGLSLFEYDVFLICMAPAIDGRYEKIYGYLQDDVTQKYASAGLIFDLLLPAGMERLRYLECFNSGPLIQFNLIRPLNDQKLSLLSPLRQAFLPTPEIISWLTGTYQPPTGFENAIRMICGKNDLPSEELFPDEELDLDHVRETAPVIILYGQDDMQQQETARFISTSLMQPLLTVDLARVNPQNLANGSLACQVMRDARLNNAIPCFSNWEALQAETDTRQILFSELNHFENIVILQSKNIWQINRNGSQHIKPVMWVKCDIPTSAQRLCLWQHWLSSGSGISAPEIEMLSGQFNLTSGQIRNAVYTARDAAFQESRSITITDLYAAARQHSSRHLESLAVKIPPRYGWNDIVLPAYEMATLHEIAETVRWRSVVLEDWGVGERLMPNAGVSALFAGPSGTGKTLAAQVIAAELKMDLYKIDLSTVVSKYIGETEKNLERIFTQAHNSNSILFFDEADAIFGKRSEVKDAHDRYANIEVGYLLQRMETYDGVVILATNLRSNLDDAFTRRLQFVVDFPFPDEEERYKIWNVLFPPGVPREPGIDFESLAGRFKLTGGNIRNIIVGAAFLAASQGTPVSTQHILHSLRREMQNMGRLVNEKDVSKISKEDDHGTQTS